MASSLPMRDLFGGFSASACSFPSRPALVVNDESHTYSDLYQRAGRIALAILESETASLPLAGVFASRSITAYSGILGVLGSGKGYVPLNPKFPVERTRRMLRLSGCTTLVVGRECAAQLPGLLQGLDQRMTIVLPDLLDTSGLATRHPQHRFVASKDLPGSSGFRPQTSEPSATAYLLFTSGSTGDPKGVPISHQNVRSYIQHVCDRYEVNELDRFSQEFDLTFDLSVHDMFVCWERGACLFSIPERAVMAPAKFIRDHELTMWFSVPSVVGRLEKLRLLPPGCFPSLRCSLFCGEPLSAVYARLWQEAASNSILENLYGPTEATIAITCYRWDKLGSPSDCLNGIVPIGWAFPGQCCAVVDENRNFVSPGEVGELCLSGAQVTSGYLNSSQKTQQQFVKLPSAGESLWYRTGDLVKQGPNGCLYYLGRIDHQIKIRGYRVELQEIDAVLRKACGTEQVVSVAWPVLNGRADGVVGFVSGVETLERERVLAYCREVLPEYMVPSEIYLREELPLNANGKVDRVTLAKQLEVAHREFTV